MTIDDSLRTTILKAEIAALLHDIGKFTAAFVDPKECKVGTNDRTAIHTKLFRDQEKSLCRTDLLEALDEIPAPCLPDGRAQLKAVGDLQQWHHVGSGLEKYFDIKGTAPAPALFFLMLYADTTDSATSKGGAKFSEKGRKPRLQLGESNQKPAACHVATPFGEEEHRLYNEAGFDRDGLEQAAGTFQGHLARVLNRYETARTADEAAHVRRRLLDLMEDHLGRVLAETRLPNNDVTLWQHSLSTAALFKAMLAGHALRNDYTCSEGGNLAYYLEQLAILGVCWREDDLIARSFRPAEILGRRKRLDDTAGELKDFLETGLCLGNEIYRDRDGIYFLVPNLETVRGHVLDAIEEEIDRLFNDEQGLAGEIEWECRGLDIGLQLCRLPEVMAGGGGVEILARGPRRPSWTRAWEATPAVTVCPRCGLRPVDKMPLVTVGSEADDTTTACQPCRDMAREGGVYRKTLSADTDPAARRQRRRLTGMDAGCQYLTYDLERLAREEHGAPSPVSGPAGAAPGQEAEPDPDTDRRNRLALVQGVLDLRPFLSGRAFAAMLAAEPGKYTGNPGKKDKSREMGTWEEMLAACEASWAALAKGQWKEADSHTLQQIFHDTRLGTGGDGRAAGKDGTEKARNFLRDTVLAAPFPDHLEGDPARLVNYALRKHPAPSRLARVWNHTLEFCCHAMRWCEANRIHYSTVSLDPGRFMVLVPARRAWDLLAAMAEEYGRRFGRVRHHLALHLSATVFSYKAPLYIAIDAARRFADLGLERSAAPAWWTVLDVEKHGRHAVLCLETGRGRRVRCRYPRTLPDGREDRFYPWFWKKGATRHPVHLCDLRPDDRIAVHRSSFDYEVLDATTRRYDIRLEDDGRRPHPVLPASGPRPYPLEAIEEWRHLRPLLDDTETAQLKHLQDLLCRLHRDWHRPGSSGPHAALAGVAEDALKLVFGAAAWKRHGKRLRAMARDGSLPDLLEWYFFIGR